MTRGYYDFQSEPLNCTHCGWTGLGRDTTLYEMFEGGAEYCCPTCHAVFGFVAFPTEDEARTDPRADPIDRAIADRRAERQARFEATRLTSPVQLPPLAPPPSRLVWDVVDVAPDEAEVRILHGDRVVWRELSFYENFRRFDEVARILKAKYGDALRDLVPTGRSLTDLLGDDLSASGRVEAVRAWLRSGEAGVGDRADGR